MSVANAITSLRLCSVLDWRQYVESVSLVEQVLQRDPAGAYGRMDFLSRDRQRQAVEELARAERRGAGAGGAEGGRKRPAGGRRADRSPIAPPTSATTSSIEGRRDLEADVAYRPRLANRIRRLVFAHTTLVYLGPIAIMTALLLAASAAYLRHEGASHARSWSSRCCCC